MFLHRVIITCIKTENAVIQAQGYASYSREIPLQISERKIYEVDSCIRLIGLNSPTMISSKLQPPPVLVHLPIRLHG